jgi:pyruvate ferredoxin oxidoreductase beta subunit
MVTFKDLPEEELFLAGSTACQGCPSSLALRIAFKALGDNTILIVVASCTSVLQGSYPLSAINLPLMNVAFATGGASASGVAAGVKAMVKRGELAEEPNVLVWAGDGGTYDIGIQSLSGAAERETDFIYVCYNNEMYSNTGTQRSGATPLCRSPTRSTSTRRCSRQRRSGAPSTSRCWPRALQGGSSLPGR